MLLEKVHDYIDKYNMIENGDKIVIGVSGGADSICLLLVLIELKKFYDISLFVCHINHGIRLEAKHDEDFVKDICKRENINFNLKCVDVKYLAKQNGYSEEEAGRIERYKFFNEVFNKENCNKIAVAHNMNDNSETILFNLFRGSGIKGLTGIMPVRKNLIKCSTHTRDFSRE